MVSAKAHLKNRSRVGSTINNELWQQFQELSRQTRIPISRLLDESVEDIIQKYKNKGLFNPESKGN